MTTHKVFTTIEFGEGGGITGLSASAAPGEPVIHEQLAALIGAVVYQGTWNATTNTPTIPAATANKGQYYVVAVAGATAIDGISDWNVGDHIICNGTAWEKIDNTEPDASTVLAGNVRLATVPETATGTAVDIAVTPAGLASQKSVANGIASLDSAGHVPAAELDLSDYIPQAEKAQANGVATLGAGGKVPSTQLDLSAYIPQSEKAAPSGVATLGGDGLVPSAQLPEVVWGELGGTLANQSDLQNGLNSKASASHTHAQADITNLTANLASKIHIVATRTVLKALDTAAITVCYLTEAGREGLFFWRVGTFTTEIATDTQEGIFLKADAIASSAGAWVRDDYLDGVRVTWFGAVADGATNNYAALSGALAVAQQQQVPLRITGDVQAYRYGTTLTMTALVPIIGDGVEQSILEYTGAGEAMKIIPPLFSASYTVLPGHAMRDFAVRHQTDGGGTYGIHLYISGNGYPYSQFLWENIEVGIFGTRSILLNNSIGATDGIFTGKFTNVFAHGGWQGVKIGDSLTFNNCRIHGTTAGQNLAVSMIAGARELIIQNCSHVTAGGIYFDACNGVRMLYNHVEIGDGISFAGTNAIIEFNNCSQVSVRGGRLAKLGTGTQPTYTIYCGGTTSTVLVDEVDMVKGSAAHVYALNTTSRIVVDACTCTFDVTMVVALHGASSYLRYAYARQAIAANANGGITAAGTTVYCMYETSATESVVNIPLPNTGTISHLYVYSGGAPGSGQTYTCTMMVAGAASALACTISGAASNEASNTTDVVSVAAGQTVSMRVVASALANISGNIKLAFRYTF